MTGGDFIRNPDRRARLLVITQGIWVATLLVLTLWWVTVLKQQSNEIARLETQLGVDEAKIQARQYKVTRMITGESSTFFLLIVFTNSVLVYLFIRDHRRSKSIQAFFASLTHELRTPLTSIKLQAETLRDIEDNPNHSPFVNRLLEDAERLEGQVQQTLELARLEGGGALTLQSIPIKSFLKNKIASYSSFHSSRVTFDPDLNGDFPDTVIFADPNALQMIFRNTIENAIKYSTSTPAQISFQGVKKNLFFHVSILHRNAQFQGDIARLGELFYRGTNSQGAGVGLYLIKSLMQKMKGKARFSAQSGFTTELIFPIETNRGEHG